MKFLNAKLSKIDCWDMFLIKMSCIAFGILLVLLIPSLLSASVFWTVVLIIILAIRPLYRFYLKK